MFYYCHVLKIIFNSLFYITNLVFKKFGSSSQYNLEIRERAIKTQSQSKNSEHANVDIVVLTGLCYQAITFYSLNILISDIGFVLLNFSSI